MILVTGSTGYLGKKIVSKLNPSQVIGLSRTSKSECFKHVNCSITEIRADIIPDNISTVIHTAAVTDNRAKELLHVNVEGTKRLIAFAKAKDVAHIIFISSSCTQLDKRNKYALSKHQAEELIINSGLAHTIIRPNYIYGPGNSQFRSIVSIIKKSKIIPVPGDGRYVIAPVHEDDLVEAIVSCVENRKALNKIYSVCGNNMSFNEFLLAIADSLNLNRRLLHINKKFIAAVSYLYDREFIYSFQDRSGDYSDAYKDLHFMPVNIIEGLKKSNCHL